MSINNRIIKILNDDYLKELIVLLTLRSQQLEYAITYILYNHPFLQNEPNFNKNFWGKPLGVLIKYLEDAGDLELRTLAESVESFNKTRIEIIHHLLFNDQPLEVLKNDLEDKIKLSNELISWIELELYYVYEFALGITYYSIFD